MIRDWKESKISAYKHWGAEPKILPIGEWIDSTMTLNESTQVVQKYRQTGKDALKKQLPHCVVGAVMRVDRKVENIVRRTGWIAIDIDQKHNPDINDWNYLKQILGNNPFIAFAGLSASAKGLWALVKIKDPARQEDYYKQLISDFRNSGIQLDTTKGKNPHDARYISYDPEPYIAEFFQIYDRLPNREVTFSKKAPFRRSKKWSAKDKPQDLKEKLEKKLHRICSLNYDLAPDYGTYLRLGFAFSHELGESGREYFHRAVCYSSKYNRAEADQQYSVCLRENSGEVTLGTFFHLCKVNNI